MIKFRAWSKDLSKYRKLDDISNDQGLGMFFEVQNGIGSNVTSICYSINDVVEQFTGLKDVNGNDIYEGDIIASKPNELTFEPLKIGVVKRSKINAGWSYRTATDEYNIWTSGKYRTYEIIGNVHENPELLEEDK